jgi:hypothetical protein
MVSLIDSFPVGTEVECEVSVFDERPRWNFDREWGCAPFKVVRGRVEQVGPGVIGVRLNCYMFGSKGLYWEWAVDENTLTLPGYIKLVNENMKGPARCQCDSFDLAWKGHDPGCPEDKPIKRTRY